MLGLICDYSFLFLLIASLPVTAYAESRGAGWLGLLVFVLAILVKFLPGVIHWGDGFPLHRPQWTEWGEEEGMGTCNWGISVGPVAYEGRRCKICGITKFRNMRHIGI